MKKIVVILFSIFSFGCGDAETDLSSDEPLKPDEFISAFKLLDKNFTATDKEIIGLADSVNIHPKHLNKFFADSIINGLLESEKKSVFYPLGRIVKNKDSYLLLVAVKNKMPSVFVAVLNNENKYLASKKLFTTTANDSYTYNLSINREPTFFVSREKTNSDKEYKYTKMGWAYSGKTFIPVVKETNERNDKLAIIVNPIDAFKSENFHSGNYEDDDRNFISIRDGRTKQDYIFFLHVDKNNGTCIGELKGVMNLTTDSTHALYSIGGDPCIIDFTFGRNSISIKEKGSCGNRRGMDCFFDEVFGKKKEKKKPTVISKPLSVINKPKKK